MSNPHPSSQSLYLLDHEQDALGRALHDLEVMGSRLDDLLIPTSPASGTNAGRPAGNPGSRPPLSLHVCDIKAEAEECVRGWCSALIDVKRWRSMTPRTLVSAAVFLHRKLLVLAEYDWAPVAAEEIITHARRVGDLIDPPPPAHAPTYSPARQHAPTGAGPTPSDPTPGEPHPSTPPPADSHPAGRPHGPGRESIGLMAGTARQVSQAAGLLGAPVSHTTIRTWGKAGLIRAVLQPDATMMYRLTDVLEHRAKVHGQQQ